MLKPVCWTFFTGKCLPSGGDDESDLFVSDDARTSDADSLKSIKDSTSLSSLESVVGFIYFLQ